MEISALSVPPSKVILRTISTVTSELTVTALTIFEEYIYIYIRGVSAIIIIIF
jgi:hypothetical protein